PLAGVGGEGTAHGAVCELQYGDLAAVFERCDGEFHSDESGTDHHHAGHLGDAGLEGDGVLEGLQRVDAGGIGALAAQGPRAGTGGEDQMLIGEGVATGVDGAAVPVNRGDGRAPPEGDVVLAVEGLLPDRQGGGVEVDLHVVLGQGWTLVGQLRAGVEDGDGVVVAAGAEGFCNLDAAVPAADDYGVHCRFLSSWTGTAPEGVLSTLCDGNNNVSPNTLCQGL